MPNYTNNKTYNSRYYFLFYAIVVILIPVALTLLNFAGILFDLNSSSLGDGRKMMDTNKGAVVSVTLPWIPAPYMGIYRS